MPWPALSIRQPWAWLIVNGVKDIENRTWPTRFRGEFYVHASKGMTRDEYESAWWFAEKAARGKFILPKPEDLERGGIVGRAEIVDCVRHSDSLWFVGNYGFVLRDASRLNFRPCKGALGFFAPVTTEASTNPATPKPVQDETERSGQ
jgi:hypothetical protein